MKRPKNWTMTKLDNMARRLARHGRYSDDVGATRATLVSLFGHPSK